VPPHIDLPLAGAHAGRSALTCELKCGSACFHAAPNRSSNDYIGDVVETAITRRTVLKGGLSALVIGALSGAGALTGARPASARPGRAGWSDSGTGLRFTPIRPQDAATDAVVLPNGYTHDIVLRWGDPVLPGAPAFDFHNQTPEAAAQQFGYNCDFIGFLPLGPGRGTAGSRRGILVVNHEYTVGNLMFPSYSNAAPTAEQVDIELAAHGMSVLEIERERGAGGGFVFVPGSRFNRRITATAPMLLTGPAAGDALLRTAADPTGARVLGTLNNCAGGRTPWGTVLSGEENFHQYFANNDSVVDPQTRDAHRRYGLPGGASSRKWERYHERFDLSQEPNEAFRFGWIVEIDPTDPTFTPRKRTALGRFKHEGATVHVAPDGRVVAYSGDDERFDYVYKFVSRARYRAGDKAHNLTLLDDGDLYVARFTGDSSPSELERYNARPTLGRLPDDGEFDGTGEWLPLVLDGRSQVPGFTVAEVLIKTRLAADAVGATKMDRPEDVERNPVNGLVYLCMTNNTQRGLGANPRDPGIDEANPRRVDENAAPTGNKYGHVIELDDARGGSGTTFAWRLFLVCGDPDDPTTFFAGYPKEGISPIAAPDNVMFDAEGNVWIATDGQQRTLGKADAFHAVPVEGPERGRVRQFLSVPAGAEACGPELTPDQRTLFCAVQHPGENYASTWPDGPGSPPRPSVIAIHATHGDKRIGS
jgi:secreted PhoX family phosphatase